MSAMDVDKALDEIIATRPRNSKRRGTTTPRPARGGASNTRGSSGPTRTPRTGPAFRGATGVAQPMALVGGRGGAVALGGAGGGGGAGGLKQLQVEAVKIICGNLPLDVEEGAIRELFVTTVGLCKEVSLSYDSRGKSKGIATIIFKNRGDALKAYEMYNNRMIDQKRPLKIEIIVDPSKVPLSARVAPLAAVVPVVQVARGGGVVRGGRGRGGAVAARPKRAVRPKKTAEDLDKEMADYAAQATS